MIPRLEMKDQTTMIGGSDYENQLNRKIEKLKVKLKLYQTTAARLRIELDNCREQLVI